MIFLLIFCAVPVVAYVCRVLAKNRLDYGKTVKLGDDSPIAWELHYNKGLAGSRLEKRPDWARKLSLAAVIIAAICFLLVLPTKGKKGLKLGLALTLGGGLANYIERKENGYVADYIRVVKGPFKLVRKYVYNVADLCIFTGTVITAFYRLYKAL